MTRIIIISLTALFLFSSPLPRDSVTLRDSPSVTGLRGHEALHITNINPDTHFVTSVQTAGPSARSLLTLM